MIRALSAWVVTLVSVTALCGPCAAADGPPQPKVAGTQRLYKISAKIATPSGFTRTSPSGSSYEATAQSAGQRVAYEPPPPALGAAITACEAGYGFDGTCLPDPEPAQPQAQPVARPQLTVGLVASAFARIPVPKERSVAQPGNKTLVNFDTIFYTRAEGFQRTVVLLGQSVTLDVSPVSYTWSPGDGTSFTTTSPGAPYPDKTVTHRYRDAHVTVRHHVTVSWGARFRVGGGPWAPVPGTVQSVGPGTALRVAEAVPVLTGRQ